MNYRLLQGKEQLDFDEIDTRRVGMCSDMAKPSASPFERKRLSGDPNQQGCQMNQKDGLSAAGAVVVGY